jgi:hypothetical protein
LKLVPSIASSLCLLSLGLTTGCRHKVVYLVSPYTSQAFVPRYGRIVWTRMNSGVPTFQVFASRGACVEGSHQIDGTSGMEIINGSPDTTVKCTIRSDYGSPTEKLVSFSYYVAYPSVQPLVPGKAQTTSYLVDGEYAAQAGPCRNCLPGGVELGKKKPTRVVTATTMESPADFTRTIDCQPANPPSTGRIQGAAPNATYGQTILWTNANNFTVTFTPPDVCKNGATKNNQKCTLQQPSGGTSAPFTYTALVTGANNNSCKAIGTVNINQ